MKQMLKLLVVYIYAFESFKMPALIPFYENIVIIYELEDKMCCISKLQIGYEFWPVLFFILEKQEYKT